MFLNWTRFLVIAFGVSAVVLHHVEASHKSKENPHQIDDLPGLHGKTSFKHFAGHLQLNTEEKLFYWYTESQHKPEEAPIVLWFNGGPGCSSMGGFFTENGPFVVDEDLSVKTNVYSWNRHVNLVWVESPAGVGFSHPLQDPSYYNDDNVADRAYEFLGIFFEKYPELKGRDFYITGESYAGIYIPYLVNKLVDTPIEGINLSGFAIGNPLTDNEIDGNAYMDYYYSHALISRENYHKMLKYCSDEIGQCMFTPVNCSTRCQQAVDEGFLASDKDQFNPYNIYGDVCLLSNGQGGSLRFTKKMKHPTATHHRGEIGPCTDTFTQNYLRQPEVQEAIHVEDGYIAWSDCNDFISEHYTRSISSLPKYRNILGKGLKILIYSGDADSVVNFIGTERWLSEDGLKLKVVDPWKAWLAPDKQIGGYVEVYEGITFKTVKGAGHMVPAVRPLHGLSMFESFVFGENVSSSFKYPKDGSEFESGEDLLDDETEEDDNLVDEEIDIKPSTLNGHAEGKSSHHVWGYGLGMAVIVSGLAVYNNKRRQRVFRRPVSGLKEETIPLSMHEAI